MWCAIVNSRKTTQVLSRRRYKVSMLVFRVRKRSCVLLPERNPSCLMFSIVSSDGAIRWRGYSTLGEAKLVERYFGSFPGLGMATVCVFIQLLGRFVTEILRDGRIASHFLTIGRRLFNNSWWMLLYLGALPHFKVLGDSLLLAIVGSQLQCSRIVAASCRHAAPL